MPFPSEDTVIDYPAGATTSAGTVVHVESFGGDRLAVILDRTAFHPIDGHWPDQPADRGALVLADGSRIDVTDALVGATDGESLFVGADVPVRTGTDGWAFVVVHVVAAEAGGAAGATRPGGAGHAGIAVGDAVRVEVDAAYRTAISLGHTACHLAALALDRVLAGSWGKAVPLDPLGAPAFDALAIESSRILGRGARDTYRVGRSLRKKGFAPSAFDDAATVAAAVDDVLAGWVASAAPVRVEAPDARLGARRAWVCELPEGEARLACGGTHAGSLAELGRVSVSFEVMDAEGTRTVVMHTAVGA